MDVRKYTKVVERTDQLKPRVANHPNYKLIPILGLAGEIGSLLAELKKRVREPHRESDLGNARIKEELGDIVWYAVAIARRAKIDFRDDVLLANLIHTWTAPRSYIPGTRKLNVGKSSGARPTIKAASTFDTYQVISARTAHLVNIDSALVPYLARIWKNSGELLDVVDAKRAAFSKRERERIAKSLGDVMWYVAAFATLYGLKLGDVVEANVEKAQSMFMPLNERIPTPLHDDGEKPLEQFPRRFSIDFIPADKETSVMLINGMRVGDPLRDNAYQPEDKTSGTIDGYRFHDCVHWAFVAVLGWSPVMRGLMKRKRKSNKVKDDAEDGARAQIVDEMVVKLAHAYASNIDRQKLLAGRDRVDMDLLKLVQLITLGLEVQNNKLWEWERAILLGFSIFDRLRRERQGRLTLDLIKRTATFTKVSISVASRFPNATWNKW
jgi:NTP pyrophosphatase (non-canonical NTP hydrolase)